MLLVTYPKSDGARFDADYYTAEHLRLVREGWTPHGLTDVHALFPSGAGDTGFTAIAVIKFGDNDSLQAALASPATPGIMADVPNFTDIEPSMHFMKRG
ncbi:EthD family reductase [Sphingomonas sp. 37zxx]|uniref:EthD family reductase n=1 Tax=Sphingomonas sp. 37zxx TaxID=1550073 RepID=UPI0009DE42A7|nr:EthD family reductase [Sphingomonas sp. 37zxx]